MKPSTLAVHGAELGARQAPATTAFRPISAPIYCSATFTYPAIRHIDAVAGGEEAGYMYGRYHNPTLTALERALEQLEGAEAAVGYGSGMAALHAAIVASGAVPGDAVVCARDVYGGTIALLADLLQPLGLQPRLADFTNAAELEQALSGERVRVVLVETVSNPLLRVYDIAQLAEQAHASGAKLLVDATFTTPMLSRPLEAGADYSVHSATKYLAGHGDVVGGVVLARAAERPALEAVRKLAGGVLGPFEAWLVLRGLQTLPLRLERQCANAARIAAWLAQDARVERVYYPGLEKHPDHALARRLFPAGLFGAMVAFEIRLPPGLDEAGTRQAMFQFFDRLQLCRVATSLGDVQTLLMYPPIASHRELSPAQRRRIGLRDNLVRLSAGIEDADDLIADLDQALGAA